MTSIFKKLLFSLAAISLLVPTTVLAVTDDQTTDRAKTKTERTEEQRNLTACTRLNTATSELSKKLEAHRSSWETRKIERTKEVQEHRSDFIEKLSDKRSQGDERRETNIDKLLEKYTEPEQQTAIKAFKTSIDSAVKTRRTSIDTALKIYRDGVNTLLQTRQTSMQSAISKMKSSIQAAITKAKSDCAAGKDAATIRQELQSSIKIARTQFETDRKAADKVQTQIVELKKTRNDSIKKAIETFKASAEQARLTLKTALQ